MAQVVAYCDEVTNRVVDIVSIEAAETRPGYITRISFDYAVAIDWIWDEAAQGFRPSDDPPVPQSITMRQARLVLLSEGLLELVDAYLESIPNPVEKAAAKITWEYSTEVQRNNPLVLMLAQHFNLTKEYVDQMFIQGSQL
jgi:hypothetical protein